MNSEMDLQDRFQKHLLEKHKEIFNAKLLIAFSGGRDSVVLCDLLICSGIKPELVHFNFDLRGKESDGDELFCHEYATKHGLKIHTKKFQTQEYADENSISIQMAARELRYDSLEKIRKNTGSDLILTAHHMDDSIETFFINLFKGTGIKGLLGIPAKNGNIVRPLLFIGRSEIDAYILSKKIEYREDSSNKKTDYLRNKIRIELIPKMLEIWPGLDKSFTKVFPNLQMVSDMADTYAASHIARITVKKNDDIHILISELIKTSHPEGVLYAILQPYGFNISQIKGILINAGKSPGKRFETNTHYLLVDREELILSKPQKENDKTYFIEDEEQDFYVAHSIIEFKTIESISGIISGSIRTDFNRENCCFLDKDKLSFPLKLRTWKSGDHFVPLGMKNSKKISDYLIDKKIPMHLKNEVRVLMSVDEIVCIVGMQVSNIFRVDDTTRNVYLVELKEL